MAGRSLAPGGLDEQQVDAAHGGGGRLHDQVHGVLHQPPQPELRGHQVRLVPVRLAAHLWDMWLFDTRVRSARQPSREA